MILDFCTRHKMRLKWDEELCGENKKTKVKNWRELEGVEYVNVYWSFESSNEDNPIFFQELNGVLKTSKNDFRAFAYVRAFCRSRKFTVKLLTTKSKVTP